MRHEDWIQQASFGGKGASKWLVLLKEIGL
jgi:hypothetical protein